MHSITKDLPSGIKGCRQLTNVENRPLIGTIIKPSIGLTPEQTAEMVKTLAGAGIDFIKDDELLSSISQLNIQG